MKPLRNLATLLLGLLLLAGNTSQAADAALAWPPVTPETKPWAYWWWLGSAVDQTNLTKELTRYRDAGLGGVHIIPIYGAKGSESNYIRYLSPQWMGMLRHTVTEAKRLGLGVDMTTGSGWCFGGPNVGEREANSSVVVKTFALGVGEKLKEKFNRKSIQALIAFGPDGKSIDLTDSISTNGEVFFSPPGNRTGPATAAPPKTWKVYAVSQKPSGQKVKRPAPGGEGPMLNLLYPDAMNSYLRRFSEAFAGYDGPKPRAQYHDSYEYKSDWSPDFFAQFEQRRGYKLQTELPALFAAPVRSDGGFSTNSTADHANRVKCDYRQTASELIGESLTQWADWSRAHGFRTRNQAHGSPGNLLDLYATADIPETEMFHTDRDVLISKFASSAAHVTGKPLVSAETGTWVAEHFTEKLSDMKYLLDDLFLSGVNHVFYHGTCYSPDEAAWPGWLFYASTEMNPRNPIWRDAPALNAYAARVQSVLQSGRPDNDILLYWNAADFWMQPGDKLLPHLTVHARDWFESQPIGKTAKELWEKGYAFDYVSDAQLKTAKVVDGKIQTPGGSYKAIVVPESKYIPLETLKQLLDMTREGAQLSFVRQVPTNVAGGGNWGKRQAEFSKLITDVSPLSMSAGIAVGPFGKGKIAVGNVHTDFARADDAVGGDGAVKSGGMLDGDDGLSFVRRIFPGGWNYFIVNRGDKAFDHLVGFDRPAKSAVILDPMTGKSGVAKYNLSDEGRPFYVRLQLRAGESVILRAFADKKAEGPAWPYWQTNGPAMTLSGDWSVKFIAGGPKLPADFTTATLASWTTFPDKNCQAFGGTAKYETSFDAPTPHSALRTPHWLALGSVQQSARVRVNGKDYGTLITPPFRVVVDNLKPTGNTLEVEVTSVAANRIRDLDRRGVPWKIFNDINIVDLNYKPFNASDWPLTDSGLLGPVTVTPIVTAPRAP